MDPLCFGGQAGKTRLLYNRASRIKLAPSSQSRLLPSFPQSRAQCPVALSNSRRHRRIAYTSQNNIATCNNVHRNKLRPRRFPTCLAHIWPRYLRFASSRLQSATIVLAPTTSEYQRILRPLHPGPGPPPIELETMYMR